MQNKSYKYQENTAVNMDEPAVVCEPEMSSSDRWNPNVPFIGTQEEWWEHFHQIEKGEFTPLKEANKEFAAWKKEYLANRLS
jgi:hypothetical protein